MMAFCCDPQKGFRFGSGGLIVIVALFSFVAAEPHHGHGHDHGHGSHLEEPRGPRVNCPQGHFWWKKDGRCYERGVQGPCGQNMVIGEHVKNRNHARCVCQTAVNCHYWPHGIVRDDILNCYPLFEQGPCGDSEWFIPIHKGPSGVPEDGFMRAKCAPRKCPSRSSRHSVFAVNGECHNIGSRGFCRNPHHTMQFIKGTFLPVCGTKVIKVPECRQGLNEGPPAGGWSAPGPVPAPPVISPPPAIGYGGAPQPPVFQPVKVPPPQNPDGGWSGPIQQQPPPNNGYGGPPGVVEAGGYNPEPPVLTPGGGYGQPAGSVPSIGSGGYGNPVAETPVIVPVFGGGGYGSGNSAATVLEPVQDVGGYSRLVSSTPGAVPILESVPQLQPNDQPTSSTPLPLPVENTSLKAFGVGAGLKCPSGSRLRSDGTCATVSLF